MNQSTKSENRSLPFGAQSISKMMSYFYWPTLHCSFFWPTLHCLCITIVLHERKASFWLVFISGWLNFRMRLYGVCYLQMIFLWLDKPEQGWMLKIRVHGEKFNQNGYKTEYWENTIITKEEIQVWMCRKLRVKRIPKAKMTWLIVTNSYARRLGGTCWG